MGCDSKTCDHALTASSSGVFSGLDVAELRDKWVLRWHGLSAGARALAWSGILAMATFLALLLAFHQVMREAVQQGDLRRKATAMHAEAVWRCNALLVRSLRDNCRAQLIAAPQGDAAQQAQNIATAAHIGR